MATLSDSFGRRLRSVLYYHDEIPLEAIDEVASRIEQTIKDCLVQKSNENPNLDRHVWDLEVGVRAYNVLDRNEIKTLRQLTSLSAQELRRLKNCGEVTIHALKRGLAQFGLSLRQ